jgi:hypothetical protein
MLIDHCCLMYNALVWKFGTEMPLAWAFRPDVGKLQQIFEAPPFFRVRPYDYHRREVLSPKNYQAG